MGYWRGHQATGGRYQLADEKNAVPESGIYWIGSGKSAQ
jgi:hypothetical protein